MMSPSHGEGRRFESGRAQSMSYVKDSYRAEFDAVVTSVDGRLVVLSESYFYPVGGGQPTDTGVLVRTADGKKFTVLNVKKGESGPVHELDGEGLVQGDAVCAVIDWQRRHRLMRSHTAAHIVSALINRETGALITGNQLDPEKVRIDFSLEQFDPEAFKAYIDEANRIIAAGRKVSTRIIPRGEALAIPSLSKLAAGLPARITDVRVITILDLDEQACGGTHVKDAAEIGRLEFVKAENKGQKNRRVYFKLAD